MPTPAPISDAERAELRRLFLAAPGGTWTAPGEQSHAGGLVAVDAEGRRTHIGAFFYGESAAQLAAGARNALPRLFAEIDELRVRGPGVPVLGVVR